MTYSTAIVEDIPENTLIRGTGPVRIGSSQDSNLAGFKGDITCIMFHQAYVLRIADGIDYGFMCDPEGLIESSLPWISGK